MAKIKFALYWAAGCGGCDVAVLDINERILKVEELADFLLWPIAMDFKYHHVEALPDSHIDVCLFNGAIRNEENEHLAKLLRQKSKIMVAFGSCAHLGGIPGLANFYTRRDIFQHVYRNVPSMENQEGVVPLERSSTPAGDLTLPAFSRRVRALDQVVKVEYYVPGCPPNPERIWEVLQAIAEGKLPKEGSVVGAGETALCDECPRIKGEKKIKEFKSMANFIPDPEICFLEQGLICCGPATRSGCGAQCIHANMPCRGCYGPLSGIDDQGTKMLSAVASVIDSEDQAEVQRIVSQIMDPAGTLYRVALPVSLLPAAGQKETT